MNIATKYGNYCALVCILLFLLFYFVGVPPLFFMALTTLVTFFLVTVFVYLSIRATREVEWEGYIDFKNAAKAGLTTVFASSILISFFIYIYYTFIDPTFIQRFVPSYEYWMKFNRGKSEEEAKRMLEVITTSFTPISAAWGLFSQTLFLETFIVLIFARFMRRYPPEEQTME